LIATLTRRSWSAVCAALLAVCFIATSLSASAFETSSLVIDTESGEHSFTIEMAVTPSERGRGLMFRKFMADDAGMLFDFGEDDEASMWMQNTYLPLDMVFIKANGTVHRIARGTTPFSTEIISSKGPVRAVLELNAGIADKIGLKHGDVVHHEMFGNAE
jgi:hypothetical protein